MSPVGLSLLGWALSAACPWLTLRTHSISIHFPVVHMCSVQGRDLWVVQATRVAASNLTATNSSSSRSGGGMVVLGRPRGQGDLGLWSPPALGSTAWLRMRSAPWFSKPLVALVGNMHGDEDINRQVMGGREALACLGDVAGRGRG